MARSGKNISQKGDSVRLIRTVILGALLSVAGCGGSWPAFTTDGPAVSGGKAEAHYRTAVEYVRNNQLPDAIDELKKAMRENPLLVDAHILYQNIRRDRGELGVLDDEYQRLIEENPRCAEFEYLAVRLDANAFRFENGLKGVIRKSPALFWPHRELGYYYAYIGEYLSAIDEFKKALELRPEDPSANLGLAIASDRAGEANAAALYEKALTLQDGDAAQIKVLQSLAQYYRVNGQFPNARRTLERLIGMSDTPDAHLLLGECYLAEFMGIEAMEAFLKVLKKRPNDPRALFGLGLAYSLLGRYADAIGYLEEAPRRADYFPSGALGAVRDIAEKNKAVIEAVKKTVARPPLDFGSGIRGFVGELADLQSDDDLKIERARAGLLGHTHFDFSLNVRGIVAQKEKLIREQAELIQKYITDIERPVSDDPFDALRIKPDWSRAEKLSHVREKLLAQFRASVLSEQKMRSSKISELLLEEHELAEEAAFDDLISTASAVYQKNLFVWLKLNPTKETAKRLITAVLDSRRGELKSAMPLLPILTGRFFEFDEAQPVLGQTEAIHRLRIWWDDNKDKTRADWLNEAVREYSEEYALATTPDEKKDVIEKYIRMRAETGAWRVVENALLEKEPDVVLAALRYFAKFWRPNVAGRLLDLIEHKSGDVRFAAGELLLSEKDVRGAIPLVEMLKSNSRDVRQRAVGALRKHIGRMTLYDAEKSPDENAQYILQWEKWLESELKNVRDREGK